MVVASGSEPEGRRFDSCPRCLTEVTPIGEEAVLKTAGRKTCGFESHGLRSMKQLIVLWPSGEGTCLTNRGSTVRIRPGLLGQHGPSVQSGVDATLSRWRSPVQIRYGSLIRERRQLADHFGLEPEMLRVRIPPFLLCTQHGMCRFPCEGRMASSTLAGCTSSIKTARTWPAHGMWSCDFESRV